MSLGDLNKSVNIQGQKTFNDAHERILRDKALHDKQLEQRQKDILMHQVSQKRLEQNRLRSEISRLKRERDMLKRRRPDAHTLRDLRSSEANIHALELQSQNIEKEIRTHTFGLQNPSFH